jgi:exodeoxyribonuclease VII small subunit
MAKAGQVEKSVTLEALIRGEIGPKEVDALKFEDALRLLEEVVTSVEGGTLPLDQAIGSYEHGTRLVQHLRRLLSGAEEKLRMLNAEE